MMITQNYRTYYQQLLFHSVPTPNSIRHDPNLGLSAKAVYTDLLFRMRLSIQNGVKFFSQFAHQFYVIFPVAELANDLKISVETITRAFKALEQRHLIKRIRTVHRTLTFLPKLAKLMKHSRPKSSPKPKMKPTHQNGSSTDAKMTSVSRSKTRRNTTIERDKQLTKSRKKIKLNPTIAKTWQQTWATISANVAKNLAKLDQVYPLPLVRFAIRYSGSHCVSYTTALSYISKLLSDWHYRGFTALATVQAYVFKHYRRRPSYQRHHRHHHSYIDYSSYCPDYGNEKTTYTAADDAKIQAKAKHILARLKRRKKARHSYIRP